MFKEKTSLFILIFKSRHNSSSFFSKTASVILCIKFQYILALLDDGISLLVTSTAINVQKMSQFLCCSMFLLWLNCYNSTEHKIELRNHGRRCWHNPLPFIFLLASTTEVENAQYSLFIVLQKLTAWNSRFLCS